MSNFEWAMIVAVWGLGYLIFRIEGVLLRIETLLKSGVRQV